MEFMQSIATSQHHGRLHGSCCSPMAFDRYVERIAGLRTYSSVPEIPSDPHDVDADLAWALLIVDATTLSDADQATFDQALQLAEGGRALVLPLLAVERLLIRDRGFGS